MGRCVVVSVCHMTNLDHVIFWPQKTSRMRKTLLQPDDSKFPESVENGRVSEKISKHRNFFRTARQAGKMAQRLLCEFVNITVFFSADVVEMMLGDRILVTWPIPLFPFLR